MQHYQVGHPLDSLMQVLGCGLNEYNKNTKLGGDKPL